VTPDLSLYALKRYESRSICKYEAQPSLVFDPRSVYTRCIQTAIASRGQEIEKHPNRPVDSVRTRRPNRLPAVLTKENDHDQHPRSRGPGRPQPAGRRDLTNRTLVLILTAAPSVPAAAPRASGLSWPQPPTESGANAEKTITGTKQLTEPGPLPCPATPGSSHTSTPHHASPPVPSLAATLPFSIRLLSPTCALSAYDYNRQRDTLPKVATNGTLLQSLTQHATRFTLHVSRITHHASRITYYVLRIAYPALIPWTSPSPPNTT
jgi:hypothetical protein